MFLSEPMQRCKLLECRGACCLYGVWVGLKEKQMILEHAEIIRPYLRPAYEGPQTWFETIVEEDPFIEGGQVIHTKLVVDPQHYGGSACVFLGQDFKCALQVASEKMNRHPWFLKPFYCVLHPLDLDEEGRITVDETKLMLDEEGSCLRPSVVNIPLLQTFSEELRYILGEEDFQKLLTKNGLE
jgi:hypothetical protein